MALSRDILLIFAGYPDPESRDEWLVPDLHGGEPVDLRLQMAEQILAEAQKLSIPIEIRYSGGSEQQMREWLGEVFSYVEQGGGGQGDRLKRAFYASFERGCKRALIVGADCPCVRADTMQEAFDTLDRRDVVVGPIGGGGYCFVGLRSYLTQLNFFEDINWGSAKELKMAMSQEAGVRAVLLGHNRSFDHPGQVPPVISVVIPTLNAEEHLQTVLERVSHSFRTETIVVDGGSRDKTAVIAAEAGARVVETNGCRINTGAEAAAGQVLLFLHPRTLLPENWDRSIRRALREGAAIGTFSAIDIHHLHGLRMLNKGVKHCLDAVSPLRGENGLFMWKEHFKPLAGISERSAMAEHELIHHVCKHGKSVVLPETVIRMVRSKNA